MGGLTAHAANWTASMTADIKLPHRGISLNFQERMLRQKGALQDPGQKDEEMDMDGEEEDEREEEEEEENEEPQTLPTSTPIIPQTPPLTPALRTEDPGRRDMEWGENLAFIDESSDSQSEMGKGEGETGDEIGAKVPKSKKRKRLGGRSTSAPRNRDKGESG